MPICPIHNCELKIIPAGISRKTGKPYNSFYACQIQGCQAPKPPLEVQVTARPQPALTSPLPPRYEAPSSPSGESKDWFGYRLGVQGHINALLSNTSVYGTSKHIADAYGLSNQEIVTRAIAIEDEADKQLEAKKLFDAGADIPFNQTPTSQETVEAGFDAWKMDRDYNI